MDKEPVFAHTSKGTVQGFLCTHNGGKDKYYSFKDVRYAQIPVGDLRFANPKEISSYQDMNFGDSDENGTDTNRRNMKDSKKKDREDCLFVHIYTPEVRPEKSDETYTRPVIVFVPSAYYYKTEFSYGEEFLMSEDVVLVVLSHRQDIFGFTGFQEPNEELNISGDAGFQDIIKGFEFVKREIRHFGGCPGNVTAYGQGLSCAYIRWLTLHPYSGKYFHKMILSSSLEHTMKRALQRRQYDLRQLAKTIGPDEELDDEKACAEYLRKVPVEKLMTCSDPMFGHKNRRVVRKNNLLAVEGDDYGVKMPVLIGSNANEALIEMYIELAVQPRSRSLGQLLWLTQTQSTEEEADKKAAEAVELYKENLVKLGRHHERCLEMIETDISYVIGTLHLATSLAQEMDPEKVYLYKFSVERDHCYRDAKHGSELRYIFKKAGVEYPETSDEEKISKSMTGIWARFARTGNPCPVNVPGATWQAVGQGLTHYFEIDRHRATYREFSDFEKARFQFWEKIYGIKLFSGPEAALENTDGADGSKSEVDNEDKSVAAKVDKSDHSRMLTCSHTISPEEESGGKMFAYTSKGPIEGDVCLYNDKNYYSFKHVPYAQLPVGKLRFAAPKDISSFEDLKRFKLDENGRYGLEDHLFLHIYTREVRAETSQESYMRPVIVFVPGQLSPKAQQYRSEDLYGPQFLLQKDVVLVVLSYRQRIFGFTAFEESNAELDVPIDAGVQDIMKAFCFVKNEIRYFGGCPDNVTAYGQGTGATYVRMIAAKNAKHNLFHKMILSSSMEHATSNNILPNRCYEVRLLLDRILGKDDADDKSCIELLRGLSAEELLHCDTSYLKEENSERAFSPDFLKNLLTAANYGTTMPVLIGYNSLEGLIDRAIWREYQQGLQEMLFLRGILRGLPPQQPESVRTLLKDIIKTYRGFGKTNKKGKECSRGEIIEIILSDLNYTVGTIALATHFARTMAPKNVYLYRFGVDLDCNFTARLYNSNPLDGAAHADELGYIFKTPIATSVIKDSSTDLAIKRMTKLWVQFARTGNPISERGDKLMKPIGKNLTHCLHISNNNVSYARIPQVEMKRFQFWESFTHLNFLSRSVKMLDSGILPDLIGYITSVAAREENDRDHKNKTKRR